MKFFCVNCGCGNESINGSKSKFCGSCGSPMDAQAFASQPAKRTIEDIKTPIKHVKKIATRQVIEDDDSENDDEGYSEANFTGSIPQSIIKLDIDTRKGVRLGEIAREEKLNIGGTRKATKKISKDFKSAQSEITNRIKNINRSSRQNPTNFDE